MWLVLVAVLASLVGAGISRSAQQLSDAVKAMGGQPAVIEHAPSR